MVYATSRPHRALVMSKVVGWDEILRRIEHHHSDKNYTYHPETYSNVRSKMKVTCSKHGNWWPSVYDHCPTITGKTKGKGCAKCVGLRLDWPDVRERFLAIWGDDYVYQEDEFVNMTTEMTIRCKIDGHPPFRKTPHQHLYKRGGGCAPCGRTRGGLKRRLSGIDVLRKACRDTHGERFDYSVTNFELGRTRPDNEWRCKAHNQRVKGSLYDHLRYLNGGCTKCDSEWSSARQVMGLEEFVS